MTTKADYTPEEWQLLSSAPLQIGLAVALASSSGAEDAGQEVITLYNAIIKRGKHLYRHNELVQSLIKDYAAEEERAPGRRIATYLTKVPDRQRIEAETAETCQMVAGLLAQKAPTQEAQEVKRFLLDIGERVATAATERERQPVSGNEARLLQKIATALKMAPRRAPEDDS